MKTTARKHYCQINISDVGEYQPCRKPAPFCTRDIRDGEWVYACDRHSGEIACGSDIVFYGVEA